MLPRTPTAQWGRAGVKSSSRGTRPLEPAGGRLFRVSVCSTSQEHREEVAGPDLK